MVSQGLTVFCISWVNPDERHADKDFESYMREGIEAAIDAIGVATGESEVAAAGYCVGGTLLAVTLAMQAATGNKRIKSATFLTTQVDFTHAGDLKVFADEEQIRGIEARMKKRGYLEGSGMAAAFNMLRPNDLIWSYVVNNYVKGQTPSAFDLLYWNADATRMPAANHSFYLRNCYLDNTLAQGRMILGNVRLDLKKVKVPIFNLATREDHIAPAISVFEGSVQVRRAGRLRAGRVGSHRRRGQPAFQAEIRVLDRRGGQRTPGGLDFGGDRAQGVVVALLVRMAGEAGARPRACPDSREKEASPPSGRRPGPMSA